jgi:hypothetical protein
VVLQDAATTALQEEDPVTTRTLDRQHTVHLAEIAVAAAGFQYGLARLLARAVESGTHLEDRQLVPRPRREDDPARV